MKEKIIDCIYSSIDEVNELLSAEKRMPKDLNTVLIGENSSIESIVLVNFIVAFEERIETDLQINIELSDFFSAPPENNPLRSLNTLLEYLLTII